MTQLTALELAGNYPDNVLITSREVPDGKYAVFLLYDARRRNTQTHA